MKKAYIAVFLLLMLTVEVWPVSAGNQYWTTWKGNPGRTSNIKVEGNARPLMTRDWHFSPLGGIFSHPISFNNKVYICSSEQFNALDRSTGATIWQFAGDNNHMVKPSKTGQSIIFSNYYADHHEIVAVNYSTGDLISRITTESYPSLSLALDNLVYYTINDGDQTIFRCKRIDDGSLLWEYPISSDLVTDSMDDDTLFIRTTDIGKDTTGKILALNSMNGSLIWQLKPETFDCDFDTNMIADNGVLYVGSTREEGALILAISGRTGELMWKYQSKSTKITCKALSDDKLLVADQTRGLYCISAQTGDLLWSTARPEMEDCLLATTDELAYVCYHDSSLEDNSRSDNKSMVMSINIKTGDILDKEKAEFTPTSICADDTRVYITTAEGELQSYKTDIGLVGIIVQPSESFLVPGQSQDFTFINYDMRKQELDNIDVRWTVNPPGLGQITKDGFFTAGNGDIKRGIIQAHHGEIAGVAVVNICDEPELESDTIDFGLIAEGDKKTLTINTNMNRYCRCNVDVKEHPAWISECSFTLDPLTEIVTLSITADASELDPGEYADYVVFKWVGGELLLNVSVNVMNTDIPAFKVSSDRIDFGKLTCWDTDKHDLTLHLENLVDESIGCDMITEDTWLDVNPRGTTVKPEGGDFTVSCKANKVLPGQSLTSIIKIKPQFGLSQEVTVTVEKLENTTLKLRIDDTNAVIDGNAFGLDVPPNIVSGRTMVPIRVISEAFGATVDWNGEERRIDIHFSGVDGIVKHVAMWIGIETAEVDGVKVSLDSPPIIDSGRTLVPVRFIGEAFGASVEWNQTNREVIIIYTP